MAELEQALRRHQVLQPMLAEIAEGPAPARALCASATTASGRHAPRRRSVTRGARRCRRSPSRSESARRCGCPSAHAPGRPASAACASAAAATASDARRRRRRTHPRRVDLDTAMALPKHPSALDGARAALRHNRPPRSCNNRVDPSMSVKRNGDRTGRELTHPRTMIARFHRDSKHANGAGFVNLPVRGTIIRSARPMSCRWQPRVRLRPMRTARRRSPARRARPPPARGQGALHGQPRRRLRSHGRSSPGS